jgi:hypothetical protein
LDGDLDRCKRERWKRGLGDRYRRRRCGTRIVAHDLGKDAVNVDGISLVEREAAWPFEFLLIIRGCLRGLFVRSFPIFGAAQSLQLKAMGALFDLTRRALPVV